MYPDYIEQLSITIVYEGNYSNYGIMLLVIIGTIIIAYIKGFKESHCVTVHT